MKLDYSLNLEQSQKLIMTPQLRQAIELLQFNSLELNEYLAKELEENPMLEIENLNAEFETDIENVSNDVDMKEFLEKYDDISYKEETDRNIKEYNYESFVSDEPDLKEHLISQLILSNVEGIDLEICVYLIQNMDRNGYIKQDLNEVSGYYQISIDRVENCLNIVQSFEPTGIGARNLEECLILQVKKMEDEILNTMIREYLEDIAYNKTTKIARELELDCEEIQRYCDIIKSLNPKPGSSFTEKDEGTKYIIPDATIEKIGDEFIITVNDYTGPRLNISGFYKGLIKGNSDEKTMDYLQKKFNSALWIINSIEQRRRTIYNVVESILKFQIDFFEKGEKHLKPLTLKEVADDLDMHESTISRSTNGKYVQTPQGLYELKYFFATKLSSTDGYTSSTTVKSSIKDIVDSEDMKKPFSDQKISDILAEKGTKVSRRTVAKYRDELNIPSSKLRKRY